MVGPSFRRRSESLYLRCRYTLGMSMIACILLPSCSLKYSETVDAGEKVPEFVFEETKMTRYENKKATLEMSADVLEQYKNTNATYAKNVKFSSFNDDGELSTEGSCGLMYADSDKKIYELYEDISLYNADEKMRFYANVLKWNEKTEQLTSGRGDVVKIEKDDTIIRGVGFSGSGISKQFSFRGNVTGDIETEEENEKESQ